MVQLVNEKILKFIDILPECTAVIGYGSGVKTQVGYTEQEKKQIDLVLVVEDDFEWHMSNIQQNPGFYPPTSKWFFKKMINLYEMGTSICYIPFIPFEGEIFKIGVVTKKAFLDDLNNWVNFYLAGRMQKNVTFIKSTEEIDRAITLNRLNALVTSLLLIDNQNQGFKELIKIICSLSFIGDTRNGIAENPHKIDNIIGGGYEEFVEIYSNEDYYRAEIDGRIIPNLISIHRHFDNLPSNFINYLNLSRSPILMNSDELLELRIKIYEFFKKINHQSSLKQTAKGLLTAGPVRSLKYVGEKVNKRFK